MQVEHLSGSRIGTYKQCPLKYHAVYDFGMKGVDHPLTLMGSGVHTMFEMATNTRIGVGACESSDPMWYKSYAVKEHGVDEELWPLMDQLVKNGVDWGYFRNVSMTHGCEVEVLLTLPDGTKVKGFIDRLDKAPPDGADVIDLKTQKREFDDLELPKNWQARIYNIGARDILEGVTGKVSVSFWVLRHRVQRVWLTQDDANRDVDVLMALAQEIRDCKDPEPKPSGLCRWCPYHKKCSAANEGVKARFRRKRHVR